MKKKAYKDLLEDVEQWGENDKNPFLPHIDQYGDGLIFDDQRKAIAFGTCDYMGLATNPVLKEAAKKAIDDYGTNTYGSQVICGYTKLHRELERKIVNFLGFSTEQRETVLFPSGLHSNIGCISALMNGKDMVFCDEYAHASIFLGIKLSGAQCFVFKHNNMDNLEELLKNNQCLGEKYIIVDGLYSVDGDFATLDTIVKLAKKNQAKIFVDEAHSFGIIGTHGRGVSEFYNVLEQIDIYTGTMSKGIGSIGGFAVLKKDDAEYVRYFATTYTSSRANPPASIVASIAGISVLSSEEGDAMRKQLSECSAYLNQELKKIGIMNQSTSHIIPVIVGDNQRTVDVAAFIKENGIHVGTFIAPTVPVGTARLRIGITSFLSKSDCDRLVQLMDEAKRVYEF